MNKNRSHDIRELIDRAALPQAIGERIGEVLANSKLAASELNDVGRELIAHFEDGLAAGRTADELLSSFADSPAVALLIGANKRAVRASAGTGLGSAGSKEGGDPPGLALLRDLRYAARRLMQSPGFTLTAILSLALGVGANAAIFSLVDSLLLRELPVERPEELINIYESSPDFPSNTVSYPDYVDLRARTHEVFGEMSLAQYTFVPVDKANGVTTLMAEMVSGSYFPLLGIEPAVGRLLSSEDDVAEGAHPVVVLGHDHWQRVLGGDPAAVGQEITINGTAYTVVGVPPESYRGALRGLQPAMYLPIMMINQLQPSSSNQLEQRQQYSAFVTGRLAEGATLERAADATAAVAAQLREEYPGIWQSDDSFLLVPTRDVVLFPVFDGAIRMGTWLLLGVVGMVLLIACANLASFLLARASDRRKEIAIRLAMGASRGALIRQLVAESMLLALVGGLAGVTLASWVLRTVQAFDLPTPLPMNLGLGVDSTVLVFALLISLAAGLVFGLIPALQATRPEVLLTLRDETAGAGAAGRLWLRNLLVAGQVAVCLVLLVGAGLFLRSLQAVDELDPGFGHEPAGVVSFAIPATRYDTDQGRVVVDELLRAIEVLPGVMRAGATANLQLNRLNTRFLPITVDGVDPPPDREFHTVDRTQIDPGFLAAVGTPLEAGRNFGSVDTPDASRAAIVSRNFVEHFWPQPQPNSPSGGGASEASVEHGLGHTFRTDSGNEYTVVGVAADTKVRELSEEARPFVYLAMSQVYSETATIVASTTAAADATALAVFGEIRRLAPDLAVYQTITMERHLEIVRFPVRLIAFLWGGFATLALALASIGLYGLVSYAQARRTREVGIRMSLGADSRSVVALLVRSGMKLVAIGSAIGLVLALVMGRVLSGLLYGVGSSDPVALTGVVLLLLAVAFVAAWVPARRASRVDPVQALRSE